MNLNEALDALLEAGKKPVCAGVAILRKNNGVIEILLAHPSGKYNQGMYGFPKGHMEEGEDEISTAQREGLEETGLDFEIIPGHRFEQNNPNKKIIIYFAKLKSNRNLDDNGNAIKHDWENDIIRFFPVNSINSLIFKNQAQIKDEILKLNLNYIIK